MKYMGSKNRLAKHILPIMLQDREPGQTWVEPFVGGGNMIDKVEGSRLGSDVDVWAIEALQTIRDNLDKIPRDNSEFTEDDYRELRQSSANPIKGYAGYAFSYSGKWLGGWRRDREQRRDYVAEAYRNALKQSPLLQGVTLVCSPYWSLSVPVNSLIYCDPPYKGTTSYSSCFDHEAFFAWCRAKSDQGHKIYVSEYQAPKDFVEVWSGSLASSLTKDTGAKRGIEKLFTLAKTH